MFGYVVKGTPQHQAVDAVLRSADVAVAPEPRARRGEMHRMVLNLRHDPSTEKRQFEITGVLGDEWAVGSKPLEEVVAKSIGE